VNSLAAQSRRDARGESHVDGWGLASFAEDGRPRIAKSLRAAFDDPLFDELARSTSTTTLVAHVRQASVGSTTMNNTHPFAQGRWVFAHNGTLENFTARKDLLLEAIPNDLRQLIRGDTDSEHVFYFWLGHLRAATGGLNEPSTIDAVASALRQTVQSLEAWFPTHEGEESKFNFIVTDGQLLGASRWGHGLSHRLLPSDPAETIRGGSPQGTNSSRAVFIASEPTEGHGWREVPDRSLLVIDQSLEIHAASLT
jgi:glutamine amidotransferase